MKLFLVKHDCEDAAVVIARTWPDACALFRAAANAWTDDAWYRDEWPEEFERRERLGVEVPSTIPLVLGTAFQRDGYEMVFRGGCWERTGDDFWSPGLREMLADRERERKQLEEARLAELAACRGDA